MSPINSNSFFALLLIATLITACAVNFEMTKGNIIGPAFAEEDVPVIPVPAANGVAVNPQTNRIFVTTNSPSIVVIDGITNSVSSIIPLTSYTYGIAVNSLTNRVFVTDLNRGLVTVIDGGSNRVLGTFNNLGNQTGSIVVDETRNLVYVVVDSHYLAQISYSGDSSVGDPARVSFLPAACCTTPHLLDLAVDTSANATTAQRLFLLSKSSLAQYTLDFFDPVKAVVSNKILLPGTASDVTFDSSSNQVLVVGSYSNSSGYLLRVNPATISGNNNTNTTVLDATISPLPNGIERLSIPGPGGVGVSIDRSNGHIFSLNADLAASGGIVNVIDNSTSTLALSIPISDYVGNIAVNSLSGKAFVTGYSGVYVISDSRVITSQPPVADAGDDQTVNEGDSVMLDGSRSKSAHLPLTFSWSQTAGPPVTLSNSNSVRPSFSLASLDKATGYVFSFTLTVRDSTGAASTDTVEIKVNCPPNATNISNAGLNTLAENEGHAGKLSKQCSETVQTNCTIGIQNRHSYGMYQEEGTNCTTGVGYKIHDGPCTQSDINGPFAWVQTLENATRLLRSKIGFYETAVRDNVKVKLTQGQFDALVDLVYNIGPGAFKASTLLKELNQGNYDRVPDEIKKWNKVHGVPSNGLTARRAREAVEFAEGTQELKNSVCGVKGQNHTQLEQTVRMSDNRLARVDFDTSSLVSNLNFNEDLKQISFDISGQNGTIGSTTVYLGDVLKGPYVVTIDDEDMLAYSQLDNQSAPDSVTLDYYHSDHTVVITGTIVVPEFSLASPVLAVSILLVVMFYRIKKWRTSK